MIKVNIFLIIIRIRSWFHDPQAIVFVVFLFLVLSLFLHNLFPAFKKCMIGGGIVYGI